MTSRGRRAAGMLAAIGLSISAGAMAADQSQPAAVGAAHEEVVVTLRARGTFEVKLTPEAPDGTPADSALGRLRMVKQFHGDLQGSSRGQMLTAMTPVEGSAGYVAIERVTGTLNGRDGTFVLQHSGTMSQGRQNLIIAVVPHSGTGELVGLAGQMVITIANGKHAYEFEYTLPAGP
jgi:hypothetical protein